MISLYYRVVTEPCDVSFISGVKQDRAIVLVPVQIIEKVPLLECAIFQKPKVINLQKKKKTKTQFKHDSQFFKDHIYPPCTHKHYYLYIILVFISGNCTVYRL